MQGVMVLGYQTGKVISSGQEDTTNVWKLKEELMSTRSKVKIEGVMLTEDEVCEELHRIDPSKASGPDEIPGRRVPCGLQAPSVGSSKEV